MRVSELEQALLSERAARDTHVADREREVSHHYESVGRRLSERIAELEGMVHTLREVSPGFARDAEDRMPASRVMDADLPDMTEKKIYLEKSLWARFKDWMNEPIIVVGGNSHGR
jgi:hypothetical protein